MSADPRQTPISGPKTGRAKGLSSVLIFACWFGFTTVLCAWMVAQHEITMPVPKLSKDLGVRSGFLARHYLGVDCPCAQSIIDGLVERLPRGGPWTEEVFLLGRDTELEGRLSKAGFPVTVLENDEQLRAHGVEGAPWLALYAPSGSLCYSGGYARTRPGVTGTVMEDLVIMDEVVRGQNVTALPAYGCAASQELRKRLDPLNFKYSK